MDSNEAFFSLEALVGKRKRKNMNKFGISFMRSHWHGTKEEYKRFYKARNNLSLPIKKNYRTVISRDGYKKLKKEEKDRKK